MSALSASGTKCGFTEARLPLLHKVEIGLSGRSVTGDSYGR
jgi:hypothetical protein